MIGIYSLLRVNSQITILLNSPEHFTGLWKLDLTLLQNAHDLRAEDLEVDGTTAVVSDTMRNLPKTESN